VGKKPEPPPEPPKEDCPSKKFGLTCNH
jgi:hypothetical protein